MRKLTFRDILATLVVAAVVVPFIGYSVRGSMPFVHDPRGMAGVGIAGCLLMFAAFGRERLGTGAFEWFMVTLGVLTLGFGIAALIAERSRGRSLGPAGYPAPLPPLVRALATGGTRTSGDVLSRDLKP